MALSLSQRACPGLLPLPGLRRSKQTKAHRSGKNRLKNPVPGIYIQSVGDDKKATASLKIIKSK
jgi:hypothetical protein